MKKTLLSILTLSLFSITCFAGNFTMDFAETTREWKSNGTVNFGGSILSQLPSTHTFRITKQSQNFPSGWTVSFCTPAGCFGSGTTTSTFQVSGNGSAPLLIDVHTSATIGTGTVTYRFADESNPSDYVDITYTAIVNSFYFQLLDSIKTGTPGNTYNLWAVAYQNTAWDLDIGAKILSTNIPGDWSSEVCLFQNCATNANPNTTYTIVTSTGFANISANFTVGTTQATGTMHIRIYDVNDTTYFRDQMFYLDAGGPLGIQVSSSKPYLYPNYPNPAADAGTSVKYDLHGAGDGELVISDLYGRQLNLYQLDATEETVTFAQGLRPGNYFYTLRIDGKRIATRNFQVLR